MGTLKKLKAIPKEDGFEITIFCNIDMQHMSHTYWKKEPWRDRVTQLLIYAANHNWGLSDNVSGNIDILMKKIEEFFTEDELLEVNPVRLKANISDFADKFTYYIPAYIKKVMIVKDGYYYDIEVTESDMQEIFRELAELN